MRIKLPPSFPFATIYFRVYVLFYQLNIIYY
jgi:hypothetical protein